MRILIVEDEKRIQDFLSRGLESAGYAVDVAGDGNTAIELVHATEYDLIILDLMLPDTDGLSVLQKIRNRKSSPPVLILSARDAVDDRVKGLELGADDYLTKPFAFVELLARVRALLRRGQPTPERLQVGDLALDCIRRKVTRGNENIELAPKEFSILEYLMRNRGRPLSRTMIVEHVWDMDYDGLTNIVDVYIRHLRSKIDDKFPVKMIHTVRGIGYMLDAPEKAEKPVERQVEQSVMSAFRQGSAIHARAALPPGLQLRILFHHPAGNAGYRFPADLERYFSIADGRHPRRRMGGRQGVSAHRPDAGPDWFHDPNGSRRILHGGAAAPRLPAGRYAGPRAAMVVNLRLHRHRFTRSDSGHSAIRQTGHAHPQGQARASLT